MTSSDDNSYIYAIPGPQTLGFIIKLENGFGTDTGEQKRKIQDEFNTACLKGACLSFSMQNFRYERFPGDVIVLKCPRVGEAFHVPSDSKILMKWEYEQIVEQARPRTPPIKTFPLV